MNRSVFLIAALLLPLAGCLGFPEGTVAPGDTVVMTVTVTDAETGAPILVNERVQFQVGGGASGLGFSFERLILGMEPGASKAFEISNDPTLKWGDEVRAQGVFEDQLIGNVDEARFVDSFGELQAGDPFTPPQSFYSFVVVSVENGVVTYRATPEEGQMNPFPQLGATVVTTVDEERELLIQRLVANVGETFQIAPPSQFQPSTLLGLEPGAYRAVGNEADEIIFQYGGSGDARLIGRAVSVQATVISITPGAGSSGPEPIDGNYGVRASPVVNGSPSPEVDYSADAAEHGDDH